MHQQDLAVKKRHTKEAGEIQAIPNACSRVCSFKLAGAILYTGAESCPHVLRKEKPKPENLTFDSWDAYIHARVAEHQVRGFDNKALHPYFFLHACAAEMVN